MALAVALADWGHYAKRVLSLRHFAWALLPLLAVVAPARAQDFNPGGRRVRPPARGGGRRTRPQRPRRPRKPVRPKIDKLIKRYTAIVMNRPHEPFPLQKLTQLYRKRDGDLDKLIAIFEKRANSGDSTQLNARLALAGIYTHAARRRDATAILQKVVRQHPTMAAPHLMLARLAERQGDQAQARAQYEAALPAIKKPNDKERVTRALMVLCIDLEDFAAARKYHETLVHASKGSLFVRKELGNELYHRGHYARAEAEFRKTVTAAAGDNRALAPALRDLGKALAKQEKMDEALAVLKRARRIAGRQAGIRAEILALLTEVFREQGKLAELVTILESEPGRDAQRLATVGGLYEETGQVDKAIERYRQALKLNTKNIDVRIRLVHLLQTAGQLDAAIKEYGALIKAAPHNADFVFELADTHIQRGERDKALKLVADLEKRTRSEGDVLAAIADFYEQIDERKRAITVLERLAKLSTGDPQHLIDLGDRYFQQDKKEEALKTWAKIRTMVRNRAHAAAILGEVYLEHDLSTMALAALREAVKLAPKKKQYRKQLAFALERTAAGSRGSRRHYGESLAIWDTLLREAQDDTLLARECRTHIVSLWSILNQLDHQVAPLTRQLAEQPPNLEAGRLLAEVQRRLHRLADAEQTLRHVIKLAPGDEGSLLALERVLIMRRDVKGAIAVLKRLAHVNPKRARQYYQRMAKYAAELYLDDDAIAYASRAVELSPNDALGHYRLAEMYRRRQDNKRAIAELRKAIHKNDRLFRAHFDLAELLLSSGDVEQADQLYRRVVRACRDEELVVRAARLSMQLNLGRGKLEALERELLPVALGNPQKPVYRRLLVELYGAMTLPLVQAARLGSAEAAQAARSQLRRIGARAVKPLLDALTDSRQQQQRIAIDVLAYVQNKGAGPALFNFASGQADQDLRVRAMVACGALRDTALLPRYRQLLSPNEDQGPAPGDAVAVAAAWGVARLGDKQARPLLHDLMAAPSPAVRSLAVLGLGLLGDKRDAPRLAQLSRSLTAGPTPRAAAVVALGELGDGAQRPLLIALSESGELQIELAALLSLARLGKSDGHIDDEVAAILARALVGSDREVRHTAMAAASALASGDYRRKVALSVPDGAITMADVMRRLAPTGYSRREQAQALIALKQPLTRAAVAAVVTSPQQARWVAQLVRNDLAPLLDVAGGDALSAKQHAILKATARQIARLSVNGFVALSTHPIRDVRKSAIELLASRDEPAAREALIAALDDRDVELCKTALTSLRRIDNTAVEAAVARLLSHSPRWSIRAHAAQALATGSSRLADEALRRAAKQDPFALVRQAALRAAIARGARGAQALRAYVATHDVEARVRQTARQLASP